MEGMRPGRQSNEDLLDHVRRVMRARIRLGDCDRAPVARDLGMSVRTLTRRLDKAGYDFCSLRDEVRRQLVARYLEMAHLSLREVTTNVGLAEVASLCRLTRRWFGATPLGVRRAALASRASPGPAGTASAIEPQAPRP